MNSRERMLAVINHETPDRVPTDIWATPEVWNKLTECFGQNTEIRALLHIDGMATVEPEYTGPPLPDVPEGETVDYWGIRTTRISYGAGAYNEIAHHPLSDAQTITDLEQYRWPNADWFDYLDMRGAAEVG
ncbi:MAG: uroporphyrinogen-III decarboxylase-like protein, partial [Aigarchaeota archaeon]|nr:uroporphyrinogen-III decarboxylase-like protein [Aigarchaeota archaeon]